MTCAVTESVSIGCPSCSMHNCTLPLPNTKACFCLAHADQATICTIYSCTAPTQEGCQTCSDPLHQAKEEDYCSAGKSCGLLTQWQQLAYLRGEPKLLNTQFGRHCMHNEQLLVHPCGVIIGHSTFYGSEALTWVMDFLLKVFPTMASMPLVLFFDNNCSLLWHIANRVVAPHFAQTALLVDIFHFKNHHSHGDTFCGTHCNASTYPKLYDPITKWWVFNSSICKQSNTWLRKYQGQL
ncbi:hypothetical protein DACRYDRAFT_58832 [Dacryopinax primogenitus]|uniref:CxC6 like cysteine cluster associated with KDZ domain-containing protein n=1 Tax=Dacryopinax primogenitus (strain DJM 731) TaxID=1858805 RepID=M5FVY9_DACPD|nr:uncharacterized protein DACRYDRAFT_58832 [Dacryopinax primogenitus]EJT97526.1 hypothetical protein DACRYDRAFT_58832 [Dacryopinax primogenitus]